MLYFAISINSREIFKIEKESSTQNVRIHLMKKEKIMKSENIKVKKPSNYFQRKIR